VTVDTANANGLSVGANGLALGVATDSVAGAMSAADHTQFTADSTKLAGISAQANKTTVTTEGSGAIEIDGVSKTVVEFATDAEVAEMLNTALPAPSTT
jgi:glyoxylate carboligase